MEKTMYSYIMEEETVCKNILADRKSKLEPFIKLIGKNINSIDRIIFLATGSSANAFNCAKYYMEKLLKIEVEIKMPSAFYNYDQFFDGRNIFIGISQGGKSTSTINAIKKVKDNYFINVTKSKTKSGIRTIPLKNTFNFVFEELLLNTKEKEYLLFKGEIKENRENILQKRIMYQIRKYIKDKNKVFHSFRKNYTQLLYKNNIEELYIKIFLGHSIKDNLSFNTYNLSKIDNNLLSSVIQKVDFEELFENIDFFKKEKEKNKKIQDFGLFL